MPLTLLVATYQEVPPSRPMSKQFGPGGGTLGRGSDNDLTLPDPLQFVSRRQAAISCRNGAYFIKDQGRNAVLLNDRVLGSGCEAQLSDGDRLAIGEYRLHIKLDADAVPADTVPPATSRPHMSSSTALHDDVLGPSSSFLADESDPMQSIQTGAEPKDPFGINLSGGPGGSTEDRLVASTSSHVPIFASGTQRDALQHVNEPLPPARQSHAPARAARNELSLLEGLEESTPENPIAARSAAASPPASSSTPDGIPDNFDPFATQDRDAPKSAVQNGPPTPNRKGASPFPADFDPFEIKPASNRSPQAIAAPLIAHPERVTETPKAALIPSASTAANARDVPKVDTEFSLLDDLQDDAAVARTPTPAHVPVPVKTRVGVSPRVSPPVPEVLTTTAPSARSEQESNAARPDVSSPVSPSAQPGGPAKIDGYARALDELLSGAGVPELADQVRATSAPMRRAGEMLRTMVIGVQRVLMARAAIKQELHVDMTIMSRRDNNPLKFEPDPSEALRHLLAPRAGGAHLSPDRALVEAFEDLQAHHLALMAGVRAALHGVLRRFDPKQLEQRLQSNPVLDMVVPSHRKAKMWDLLTDLHKQMESESEDEFDRLFGHVFRTAYEEQERQLRGMKRKDGSKPS
ncbi:MAG: type VI secretion system-associated FHA domain protein TagH, partial [Betaproteobacteria bacterium]